MKIAITGAFGFLGWHAACRIRALHGAEVLRLGRQDFASVDRLVDHLAQVDAILHLAGVNRADSDRAVEQGNIDLAVVLADAMRRSGKGFDVVFANSTQAKLDNAYGRGKATAAQVLEDVTHDLGGSFANIHLPNIFGEHGRPNYNSFVATFTHQVLQGRRPVVRDDREIELLHAQDAAEGLISALGEDASRTLRGEPWFISAVRDVLLETDEMYRARGEIPDISTPMKRDLFNTYRAGSFPDMWPLSHKVHADHRGQLFETVRSHGGTGMSFISTTAPGMKRGEHYHLRKVERFSVVNGEAEIELRRLLHDDVIRFRLSGDDPSFVDMPTLWVHNIRNVGTSELVTAFWSDQLLDSSRPDQFPEDIAQEVASC